MTQPTNAWQAPEPMGGPAPGMEFASPGARLVGYIIDVIIVTLAVLVIAILGALLLRALGRPWLAILIGGIYATSDEFHQHFVRGRHAAWYDVVIDTVGVTIGVVVWRRSRWSR